MRLSVAERHIVGLEERIQARAAFQESARRMTDILEKTSDGFFAARYRSELHLPQRRGGNDAGGGPGLAARAKFWKNSAARRDGLRGQLSRRHEQPERDRIRGARPAGKTLVRCHSYPSGGGISVFFRDITERKRSEDERLTTSKLESLGTLAGGIAHDLNNILTVISGNIGPRPAGRPRPKRKSSFLPRARPDRQRSMPPASPASSSPFRRAAPL